MHGGVDLHYDKPIGKKFYQGLFGSGKQTWPSSENPVFLDIRLGRGSFSLAAKWWAILLEVVSSAKKNNEMYIHPCKSVNYMIYSICVRVHRNHQDVSLLLYNIPYKIYIYM